MDRANVTSGAAFKTALRSTFVLVVILLVSGATAYFYLKREMIAELEGQIVEDRGILNQIYAFGGLPEVMDAIGNLRHPLPTKLRILGLFDAEGKSIVGNIKDMPAIDGWAQLRLTIATPANDMTGTATDEFLIHSAPMGDLTLVIGRNLGSYTAKEDQLLLTLAVIGLILACSFLLLGYGASMTSLSKLDNMADVLDRVSKGDDTVRLEISYENDQIDRVARAMNGHLDRLSLLMGTTRANAAAIAHDLRTPLSRAFLAVEKAQDQLDRGADTRARLDEIEGELVRLRSIFDVILRISRLEQATDASVIAEVPVAALLADLAESFGVIAEDKGQTLVLKPVDPALVLMADSAMLSQLLANLLQNAVNHCPPETLITLGALRDGQQVRLWVADTGPGIPEAERDKVFEMFYSVDPNRTKGGNGLGLALVKAITERLGGRITLSDAAPGLRADVLIPAPEKKMIS